MYSDATHPLPCFLEVRPLPSCSTLFPYTTLFRSGPAIRLRHPARRANPVCDHDRDLLVEQEDGKSTRLNSSHRCISYAVFCLKKKRMELYMPIELIERRSSIHWDLSVSMTLSLLS